MKRSAIVNMGAVRVYIIGYLSSACNCDPDDWDVDGAAAELVDFMVANCIESVPEVPVDVFVDIIASHALM